MTDRDRQRLVGVHPDLVRDVEAVLAAQESAGTPMFVVQGARTLAEQQAIYAKGRTTPGPNVTQARPMGDVVTMKDGTVHPSDHQARPDGFGHAVDCAFVVTPKIRDPFSSKWPWETYGLLVEGRGRTWGGRWSHPHDSPHMEMA